jgi:hypothetical protein
MADIILDTEQDIAYARLLALKGALRLQSKGMRSSGRQATAVVADLAGVRRMTVAQAQNWVAAQLTARQPVQRTARELQSDGIARWVKVHFGGRDQWVQMVANEDTATEILFQCRTAECPEDLHDVSFTVPATYAFSSVDAYGPLK